MIFIPAGAQFCVYQHSISGVVFYVGKGRQDRPFSASQRNDAWLAKVKDAGFCVEIVAWYETEDEALAAERTLIRALQPECNIVHNGAKHVAAALAGEHRSPELREKVRDNMAALASTPEWQERIESAEQKRAAAKARQKKNRDRYSRAIQMGKPKQPRKMVRCVETREVFSSIGEAARVLGLRREGIKDCVAGKIEGTGGRKFVLLSDEIKQTRVSKHVLCVDTGQTFRTARHAAEFLNIDIRAIGKVLAGKRTSTRGKRFVFVVDATHNP